MFEFLRNRKGHIPQPPTLVNTVPSETTVGLIVPGMVLLKPKKWVTVKGKVGIVTAVDTSGYVKVTLTNADGTDLEKIRVPVGELKLAKYLEIPASRRGDQVVAATLGYV